MKISAFSMCRNAEKLYYPVEQSVRSVLPLVDEFVMVIGDGDADDRTRELLASIDSPKLKLVSSEWDVKRFPNGTVHAQQTDLAKSHCTGDWLLYLQADEVLHEEDLPRVQELATRYLDDARVEGFLFQYLHFWGDYDHTIASHGWYPKEIRMIRNRPDIHSWESAQSFRSIPSFDGHSYRKKEGSRKINVIETDIRVFHYGWLRPPALMTEKMNRLDRIHSHEVTRYEGRFDYGDISVCKYFEGSHPGVMRERLATLDWDVKVPTEMKRPKHKHERWKNRVMTWVERNLLNGRQLFAFQNYKKID